MSRTNPLIQWLHFCIGIHPHMEMLDFKISLKECGHSESYGIVESMQNWNTGTPGQTLKLAEALCSQHDSRDNYLSHRLFARMEEDRSVKVLGEL